MALKGDGTVVAWEVGTNNTGIYPYDGQSLVPAGLTGVTAISAGVAHTLALVGTALPFITTTWTGNNLALRWHHTATEYRGGMIVLLRVASVRWGG